MQGLPGVSLQWGAWGGMGMAAQEGPLLARLARLGMGAIQPVQGLTTLQRFLQGTDYGPRCASFLWPCLEVPCCRRRRFTSGMRCSSVGGPAHTREGWHALL